MWVMKNGAFENMYFYGDYILPMYDLELLEQKSL